MFYLISTLFALLGFCFIRFCLDTSLNRFAFLLILFAAFMPIINIALTIVGLCYLIVEGFYNFNDLDLKDNKFNRWLFDKYHWEWK